MYVFRWLNWTEQFFLLRFLFLFRSVPMAVVLDAVVFVIVVSRITRNDANPFLSASFIHKKLSISYQIYTLICQSMHLFGSVIRFKCFLCANWNCHPLCGSPLRICLYRYGLMMRHWFRQINTHTHRDIETYVFMLTKHIDTHTHTHRIIASDNWFMPSLYRIAF